MLLYGSNQAVLNFGAGIIFMVQDTKLRMTSFPVKIELSFFVFIEIDPPADEFFDLRPLSIINGLGLRKPIYKPTASYGHFGRKDLQLPWEWTDKATVLQSALAKMN